MVKDLDSPRLPLGKRELEGQSRAKEGRFIAAGCARDDEELKKWIREAFY